MINLIRLHNFLLKRSICTTSKLKGYIVLVPEIGEDEGSDNALVNPKGLPKFNHLTVENCLASIAKQSNNLEKTVKNIETKIIDAENEYKNKEKDDENINEIYKKINLVKDILNPLEDVTFDLETTWGIAKTLYLGNSSLMPTKYYLNIHDRAKRAKSSKFNNKVIYDFIEKSVRLSTDLKLDEKRLANKYLLEGKLNGLQLPSEKKVQLINILKELANERSIFKNKVDASMRQFSQKIDNYSLIRSFPPDLQYSIALDKNHPTKGPWKITLQSPQLINEFLKYCPDRDQRWNVWQANVRKASNFADKSLDNSTHIEIIRSLRQRQAKLLGYKNYTEMSMETKMIKSYENAKKLFSTLLNHSKDAQINEIETLQEFAIKNGFNNKLDLCDLPYWKRKYLKAEYNIDEEQLREYFPLPHVINEIIKLCEKLFDIKLIENENTKGNLSSSPPISSEIASPSSLSSSESVIEVWHESVKYYDVFDNNNTLIGGLYIDFYSRDNNDYKTNSGWMIGVRNKSKYNNNMQNLIPLSALIFNFGSSIYGKSYLLTINDLKIVLKNFGTALQHLLTKSRYSDISGLSNVEWDAAEICGNVMMNFLENQDILKTLSCHYTTEEQLPSLAQNESTIKVYNNYMAGYNLCKELYLSHLDLLLYSTNDFWLDCVRKLWPIYLPSQNLDKKDYHLCSMTDIFSGDWAAGYFSHLHSKIIADDIYYSFVNDNKNDIDNNDVIKRFRDKFLYNDGSITTAEIFRRFRGRDPSPLPFLKRLNLLNNSNNDEI